MAEIDDLRKALVLADEAGDAENAKALALQLQTLEGAGSRGGSGTGGSTGTRAEESDLTRTARRWGSVATTAPAKAIAGLIDLPNTVRKLAGGSEAWLPFGGTDLSGKVNNLTNALAGEEVPQSIGRAAFEGALTAPISGARGLAGLAAGAGGGAGSEAAGKLVDPDAPAWQKILAVLAGGLAGGKVSGAAAGKVTRIPGAAAAERKIQEAGTELTRQDWEEALARSARTHELGGNHLPSQAFSYPAPGMEALEQSLLASHLPGASKLRQQATQMPRQVDEQQDTLRQALMDLRARPLDRSVPALLQPPAALRVEQAQEGMERAREILQTITKDVPIPKRGAVPSVAGEGVRAVMGTQGMVANVTAGIARGITSHSVDRALLRIWNSPNGVERLAQIANLPPNHLTPAALLATLPELQEIANGP